MNPYMDAEPLEPIPPGHCEGGGPSFMDEDDPATWTIPGDGYADGGTPYDKDEIGPIGIAAFYSARMR